MKRFLHACLLGTTLAAAPLWADQHSHDHGTTQVQAGDLMLSGAFTRATLPRAPVGGAFVTITNQGASDDRLISATAPVGSEVQIHEMAHANGVMTMRQLADGLPIPAGQSVALEPGGYHLMLMGLTEPLIQGETLDITLRFEQAGDVTLPFAIGAINAAGVTGHMHAAPAAAQGHAGHATDHGTPHGAGHAPHDTAAAFDQTSVSGDEARITGLLKAMFESPEAPLTVAPILIDGDIAVIGWSQHDTGGRALLRRDDSGLWRVSLCAGDGLKGADNMIKLGIDADTATRLATAQASAEAALPAAQVARFALFDGILHVTPEAGQ